MISIYDWYIMLVCVGLLVVYILMTFMDREDTK
jgi:hypothetical protein